MNFENKVSSREIYETFPRGNTEDIIAAPELSEKISMLEALLLTASWDRWESWPALEINFLCSSFVQRKSLPHVHVHEHAPYIIET